MKKNLIDPNNVIDYNRTRRQLQLFFLFCIVVAGKNAKQQAKKLEKFLEPIEKSGKLPFDYIDFLRAHGRLRAALQDVKIGQYARIQKAFLDASVITDLENCTLDRLLRVHGVGPKTARFFLVMSRRDAKHAILDTHILHFLRDSGIDAPKATPSGRKYQELEAKFLEICESRGETVANFDLRIWKAYSQGNGYADLI
jgi:thermostable 8-oxoguanine DNA glycosylase